MYLAIFFYLILLLGEGLFKLDPIVEFGDFTLSYNLLFLITINIIFLLKYLIKPFLFPTRNFIFWFHIWILISFIPVVLFRSSMMMGGLSLIIQLYLQSIIILILYKTLKPNSVLKYLQLLSAFAFVNCGIVYGSYIFPESFKGIAEIHGYFGYNPTDKKDILRVFGVMGDVAPWFLSFFAIWALQAKNYISYLLYASTCVLGASLGASALVIMATVLHFYLKSQNKGVFVIRFVALILVGGFIVLTVYFDQFKSISIVKRILDPTTFKSASGAQRLFSYGLAIDLIKQSPIWGWGYGTFLYNLQSWGADFFRLKFGFGALSNANNQILQILYEGGIIGLIFFIFMVRRILTIMNSGINWFKRQHKMLEFKKASFIWFLSMITMNQTAVWMIPSIFWFLIVSLIGICLFINKNISLYEGDPHYGINR